MNLGNCRYHAAAVCVVFIGVVLTFNVNDVFASPQDFLDRASGLAGAVAGEDDSAANSIPHHHNNFGCDCMEYWSDLAPTTCSCVI